MVQIKTEKAVFFMMMMMLEDESLVSKNVARNKMGSPVASEKTGERGNCPWKIQTDFVNT